MEKKIKIGGLIMGVWEKRNKYFGVVIEDKDYPLISIKWINLVTKSEYVGEEDVRYLPGSKVRKIIRES